MDSGSSHVVVRLSVFSGMGGFRCESFRVHDLGLLGYSLTMNSSFVFKIVRETKECQGLTEKIETL